MNWRNWNLHWKTFFSSQSDGDGDDDEDGDGALTKVWVLHPDEEVERQEGTEEGVKVIYSCWEEAPL